MDPGCNELGSDFREPRRLAVRRPVLDVKVCALDVAELTQGPDERGEIGLVVGGRHGLDNANAIDPQGLLSADRAGNRPTAQGGEARDDLPPSCMSGKE